MENVKVIIPEVTSSQLFKLVMYIYPAQQVPVERLNGIFGRSTVFNAAITGESIGILIREKSTILLTQDGQNLGRALVSKNLEEQRKILKELVLKNPILEFVYSLIKEKKIMKNREIGQKVSTQFNKNWKHEQSYARYGTNCGDILSASGLGDYLNGIYSIAKIESSDITEGTSSPYLRFDKILKIMSALSAKEKTLDDLTSTLNTKKERLSYELKNCIDLNLVKKSGDIFSSTTVGRNLINPVNTKEIQKNLFAEVLRKSPYSRVIEIIEKNDGIDRRKIGDILSHELKKEAGEGTRYDIGKKFADWLGAAGIINIQRSKVNNKKEKKIKEKKEIIIPANVKETTKVIPDIAFSKPQTIPASNQVTIFQVGRLIERIEIKNSINQDIVEDIKELIKICENDVSFKAYINLLSSHFKLYSEIKDFRIIEADLTFLKEKFGN